MDCAKTGLSCGARNHPANADLMRFKRPRPFEIACRSWFALLWSLPLLHGPGSPVSENAMPLWHGLLRWRSLYTGMPPPPPSFFPAAPEARRKKGRGWRARLCSGFANLKLHSARLWDLCSPLVLFSDANGRAHLPSEGAPSEGNGAAHCSVPGDPS